MPVAAAFGALAPASLDIEQPRHRATRSCIAHHAGMASAHSSVDAVWAAVDTLIDQAPSPQVFQAAPDEAWLTANADPIQLLM